MKMQGCWQFSKCSMMVGLSWYYKWDILHILGCGRHFRHGAHGTPKFSAFKQQLKRDVFQSDPFQSPEDELLPPPFFDEKETSSNVTLLAGQTALLHCTVRNVGNKSVSSYNTHIHSIGLARVDMAHLWSMVLAQKVFHHQSFSAISNLVGFIKRTLRRDCQTRPKS